MKMYLSQLGKRAEEINNQRGYNNRDKAVPYLFAMVMTEFAELIEADRCCRKFDANLFNAYLLKGKDFFIAACEEHFKGTIEEELADIFIRLSAAAYVLDIKINIVDDKDSNLINELSIDTPSVTYYILSETLFDELSKIEYRINSCFRVLLMWANYVLKVDIKKFIELKLEYLKVCKSEPKRY